MSTKSFEINQKTIEKDNGSIILYQRSDHKNPKWQTRIKIDGSTGYIRRSCKTLDQTKAISMSESIYKELVYQQHQTGSINTKTLNSIFIEFINELVKTNKSPQSITELKRKLEMYSIVFLGKMFINEITSKTLSDFVHWRREHGVARKPSDVTIKKEISRLKGVFKFAIQKNYLTSLPDFPIVTGRSTPRPNFTRNQYRKLTRNLREWVKKSELHTRVYRDRFYLHQYILVLSNSGIRIGECRELKWQDIEFHKSGNNESIIIFWVTGKTRKRQVIPQPETVKYIQRIKEFRTKELGQFPPEDEYVFCKSDGSSVGSYKKGFETVLKEYNLQFDIEGSHHTLYSLRHTYATIRIEEGVEHYLLAQNMGTSVEMLEKFYVRLSMISMAEHITKSRKIDQNKE